MSIMRIAWCNMRQRLLATVMTVLLVAIGVGLVSAIWIIQGEVQHGFGSGVAGKFDLVVGPKGSPLQLVLNAVFHMDKPVGNLSYAVFEKIRDDRRVKLAVPMVLGDNVQGFHLVGTSPEFLTQFEYAEGRRFAMEGRAFAADFEAVLGAEAARRTGLRVGQTFVASHGIVENPTDPKHEKHSYTVTGILAPTGTPHDRALYCSLGSVYELHDEPGSPLSKGKKLSAVLVLLEHPMLTGQFAQEINESPEAQAAYPMREIGNLMHIVGRVDTVLLAVSYLVLLAAGVSIFVSIYNSMAERRREIAIIRALGAPAGAVFRMIVIEAATICFLGAIAGLASSHGAIVLGRGGLEQWTGVAIGQGLPNVWDAALFGGTLLLGGLSALVPAIAGYRTDVASNLRPLS